MTRNADFWSRRKARVKAEEEAAVSNAKREQTERAVEARTDAEVLEALDLPDPDTLSCGDDFRAFMNHAVPDRLRRRALRRLWVSNPALANLDALVDYGEDFTDSATVVANLQTAYQVGKGILRKVEETASASAVPKADEPTPDEAARECTEPAEPDGQSAEMFHRSAEARWDEAPMPAAPRRMRFAFAADDTGQEMS